MTKFRKIIDIHEKTFRSPTIFQVCEQNMFVIFNIHIYIFMISYSVLYVLMYYIALEF